MNRRQFLVSSAPAAALPLAGHVGQAPLQLRTEAVTREVLLKGDGVTAVLGF
ncbi:hypothetical protein HTT03_17920 [Sulfitobacter sp. S0837]|uniref:hypothetical protein n=1 Tax=Sulfitobacter maritimus TaxID=2741719 RepID=UPI0015838A90|nr:hypothetical protein [Sulfitobacter maritimus]NUH67166.1 hypothetical protein [Sulfitobacter maritimus]